MTFLKCQVNFLFVSAITRALCVSSAFQTGIGKTCISQTKFLDGFKIKWKLESFWYIYTDLRGPAIAFSTRLTDHYDEHYLVLYDKED